jgi:hypothetical protein
LSIKPNLKARISNTHWTAWRTVHHNSQEMSLRLLNFRTFRLNLMEGKIKSYIRLATWKMVKISLLKRCLI